MNSNWINDALKLFSIGRKSSFQKWIEKGLKNRETHRILDEAKNLIVIASTFESREMRKRLPKPVSHLYLNDRSIYELIFFFLARLKASMDNNNELEKTELKFHCITNYITVPLSQENRDVDFRGIIENRVAFYSQSLKNSSDFTSSIEVFNLLSNVIIRTQKIQGFTTVNRSMISADSNSHHYNFLFLPQSPADSTEQTFCRWLWLYLENVDEALSDVCGNILAADVNGLDSVDNLGRL